MKKVLAFDLDDTLAITKSPMSDEMAEVLGKILEHFEVCVISGGKYGQFQQQVVTRLHVDEQLFTRLHLMPACGTQYYRYDLGAHEWQQQYSEGLTDEQKTKIREVLESSARQLGHWPEHPVGEVIEDRESQLTMAALGQDAPAAVKYAWDPDNKKRLAIREIAQPQIPDLEIRLGGTTSIDVTKKGVDKAYGMQKLIDALGITKEDILFFGDKLQEGGNDYPVKAFGIESIEVKDWEDTVAKLKDILLTVDPV